MATIMSDNSLFEKARAIEADRNENIITDDNVSTLISRINLQDSSSVIEVYGSGNINHLKPTTILHAEKSHGVWTFSIRERTLDPSVRTFYTGAYVDADNAKWVPFN